MQIASARSFPKMADKMADSSKLKRDKFASVTPLKMADRSKMDDNTEMDDSSKIDPPPHSWRAVRWCHRRRCHCAVEWHCRSCGGHRRRSHCSRCGASSFQKKKKKKKKKKSKKKLRSFPEGGSSCRWGADL